GTPVGVAPGRAERLLPDGCAGDLELRPGLPSGWIGAGLEDRAGGRDAPFVDLGSHGMVDLFEQHGAEGLVAALSATLRQAELLELLGEAPQTTAAALRHWV